MDRWMEGGREGERARQTETETETHLIQLFCSAINIQIVLHVQSATAGNTALQWFSGELVH